MQTIEGNIVSSTRLVRWLSFSDAMEAANISDEDLAESLGVAQGTIDDWKRGYRNPSAAMVRRLSIELKVDAGQLLTDLPDTKEPKSKKISQ